LLYVCYRLQKEIYREREDEEEEEVAHFTLHAKLNTTFVHVFSLQGQHCVVIDASRLKDFYSGKK
jgi:hypothetical protein